MDPPAPEDVPAPGKVRTWWHPVLVRLLEWVLQDSCEVYDEVSVGRMPLRLDVVLIRRRDKEIPATAFCELKAISERLNLHTLIEFKSPSDRLEYGDWNKLLGCAHLYVAQAAEPVRATELTLVVLAPILADDFRRELEAGGQSVSEVEPGIHAVAGAVFTAWIIEADRVVGIGEPVLSLFSHQILVRPRVLAKELGPRHTALMEYALQQLGKLSRIVVEENPDMASQIRKSFEEIEAEFLASLPIEKRLQGISAQERLQGIPAQERLQGIPAQERLRGIPAQERLRGLSTEELLESLSDDEKKRLLKLLEEKQPKR